jgi:phage-related protein (TIGR01555 family)
MSVSNVHPLPGRVDSPILDTLVNLLSGLGTAKDKSTSTQFTLQILDPGQLLAAYRGDWVARKIIDCPAQDSTREWRSWQADKKDITEIEKTEKDLKLQSKVKVAMQRARLWGGAALILGVDQGSHDKELKVDRVRQGQLKYVHVVNKQDIQVDGGLDLDVTSEFYGEPVSYTVNSPKTGIVKIHPSRVIRFLGNEIPDINLSQDGWGDSTLQSIYDAVIQAGQTAANVASLVNEAKIDVVQIPGLMQMMGTQEYRAKLIERFTLANSMKSLTNTLILDGEEEWNRLNASFAGLPDIIRMYLLMASGAADIPATRLLGQSSSGLNATGQEDTRNYYDRLASEQTNDLTPRLDRLDEVLVRSTFGDKPEEMTYDWNSLWQLSKTEAADVAVKKATVYTADVNAGLLPPEVMREGRENQLIEDQVYPGLEQAIDEYGQQNLDEYNQAVVAQMGARAALMAPDDPNDPNGGKKKAAAAKAELTRRKALPPPRPPAARSQDSRERVVYTSNPRGDGSDWLFAFDKANAAIWKDGGPYPEPRFAEDETTPRSLYVRRDVLNGEEILAHFAEQGVDVSGVEPEDLHVTVLYSRQPVDWIKMGESSYGQIGRGEDMPEGCDMCVRAGGPRVMEAYGVPPDTLVMCFASSALCWRHQDMVYKGASEDYEFSPHLSIAPWDGTDPRTYEAFQGEIELGPEIFEPCKSGGAGGEAYDYDPSEPRAQAGTAFGGQWTREGAAAARQSRIDKTLATRSERAKGDVGARLKRTREAAVAKSKRVTAAAVHKAVAFLKNNERRSKSIGALAASLSGMLAGVDHVTEAMIHQAVSDFSSTLGVTVAVGRTKMREALNKAIKIRRGLTGDAEEPEAEDEVLQTLLALLKMLDATAADALIKDWRGTVGDYSPDQPRVPRGSEGGGRFATSGGAYTGVLEKAGMFVRFVKARRLESGRGYNAFYKKNDLNPSGNPQTVEVGQQVRGVKGKWNKNTDHAGDYAAGSGWLLLQEFSEMGRFADQFWRDAAQFMTPGEYERAKPYFSTRTRAFVEGFRATYSPNGKAFGLSRARTSEVFGRATSNMSSGIDQIFAPPKPGLIERTGERIAKFFGV